MFRLDDPEGLSQLKCFYDSMWSLRNTERGDQYLQKDEDSWKDSEPT